MLVRDSSPDAVFPRYSSTQPLLTSVHECEGAPEPARPRRLQSTVRYMGSVMSGTVNTKSHQVTLAAPWDFGWDHGCPDPGLDQYIDRHHRYTEYFRGFPGY